MNPSSENIVTRSTLLSSLGEGDPPSHSKFSLKFCFLRVTCAFTVSFFLPEQLRKNGGARRPRFRACRRSVTAEPRSHPKFTPKMRTSATIAKGGHHLPREGRHAAA